MAAQAIIELITETKDGLKNLNAFQKSANKSLAGIEKKLGAFQTAAIAAFAVFAGSKVVGFLEDVVDAASAQEDAINQLNTALQLSGDYTEQTSREMQDFASQLQDTTTIGDETTLQMLALAKSFGISNDQAKDLVNASVNLSAVTGKDLKESVKQLGKTFGGVVGEAGELLPELKGLSAEALKSGSAIDFVNKRFSGAGESLTRTFSGAVKQSKNTFGDLLEVLGDSIIKNEDVINVINTVAFAFKQLGKIIVQNKDFLLGLVSTITSFAADTIPIFFDSISLLIASLSTVKGALGGNTDELDKIGVSMAEAANNVRDFRNRLESANSSTNKATSSFKVQKTAIAGVGDSFKDIKQELSEIEKSNKTLQTDIDKLTLSSEDFARKQLDQSIANLKSLEEQIKATNSLSKAEKDRYLSAIELNRKLLNEKAAAESGGSGLKGATESIKTSDVSSLASEFSGFIGALQGVIDAIPNLLSQVTNLFNSAADLPNAIARGVRGLVKSIVKFIAQGIPDLFKQIPKIINVILTALAEGIPNAIISLAEALPDLILEFFNRLPDIVDKFIDTLIVKGGLVRIVVALAKAAPLIGIAIVKGMAQAAVGFGQIIARDMILGLRNGFAALGRVFSGGIKIPNLDLAKRTREALARFGSPPKWLESFVGIIKKLVSAVEKAASVLSGGKVGKGIGGAVGKAVGGLKKAVGLADGGLVPPGFNNDTFPARLSSGELVLPRGDVNRLSDFLDRQERQVSAQQPQQNQPVIIQLQVGEKQLADVMLNLNRHGFRTA